MAAVQLSGASASQLANTIPATLRIQQQQKKQDIQKRHYMD
jgi:hypothetical protein